ncbi:MAG: hypothetical protein SVR94_09795 [Pseudomonadota bacterium]|nr:hypothetical protein [Pseudomonadota bacterium]
MFKTKLIEDTMVIKKLSLFLVISTFFLNTSATAICLDLIGICESTDKIVNIFKQALADLDRHSMSWKLVLERTRDQLIEEGKRALANEVQTIIDKSVADVGIEARCTSGFIGNRVRNDVLLLLQANKLTKVFIDSGIEADFRPVVCKSNPSSINLPSVLKGTLNTINIDGYNFDAGTQKAFLVDRRSQNPIDVSNYLHYNSRYLMVFNLNESEIKQLLPNSKELLISVGEETTSTPIIRPIETRSVPIDPIYEFCPKHVGGDREFKGHGPVVRAKAELKFDEYRNQLYVQLYLHAKETKKDWTEAKGYWNEPVKWNIPLGYKIYGINDHSPRLSTASYEDKGHGIDSPNVLGDGLVSRFDIMGDRKGKDIRVREDTLGNCGHKSVYMDVYFNNVIFDIFPILLKIESKLNY